MTTARGRSPAVMWRVARNDALRALKLDSRRRRKEARWKVAVHARHLPSPRSVGVVKRETGEEGGWKVVAVGGRGRHHPFLTELWTPEWKALRVRAKASGMGWW